MVKHNNYSINGNCYFFVVIASACKNKQVVIVFFFLMNIYKRDKPFFGNICFINKNGR